MGGCRAINISPQKILLGGFEFWLGYNYVDQDMYVGNKTLLDDLMGGYGAVSTAPQKILLGDLMGECGALSTGSQKILLGGFESWLG
eukprot:3240713-Ditylum_brightwellii.AAC.1